MIRTILGAVGGLKFFILIIKGSGLELREGFVNPDTFGCVGTFHKVYFYDTEWRQTNAVQTFHF